VGELPSCVVYTGFQLNLRDDESSFQAGPRLVSWTDWIVPVKQRELEAELLLHELFEKRDPKSAPAGTL
jgi:hypothetical protein